MRMFIEFEGRLFRVDPHEGWQCDHNCDLSSRYEIDICRRINRMVRCQDLAEVVGGRFGYKEVKA